MLNLEVLVQLLFCILHMHVYMTLGWNYGKWTHCGRWCMKYNDKVCNEIIDGSLQCSIVTQNCITLPDLLYAYLSLWEKERRWELSSSRQTMPLGVALIFITVICNHIPQRCRGFSDLLYCVCVCVSLSVYTYVSKLSLSSKLDY